MMQWSPGRPLLRLAVTETFVAKYGVAQGLFVDQLLALQTPQEAVDFVATLHGRGWHDVGPLEVLVEDLLVQHDDQTVEIEPGRYLRIKPMEELPKWLEQPIAFRFNGVEIFPGAPVPATATWLSEQQIQETNAHYRKLKGAHRSSQNR